MSDSSTSDLPTAPEARLQQLGIVPPEQLPVLALAAGGQLAKVLDGCANQLVEVFGDDAGIPARVAVGMAELPFGAAVETEMMVALHD